jgi:hypothetical protein
LRAIQASNEWIEDIGFYDSEEDEEEEEEGGNFFHHESEEKEGNDVSYSLQGLLTRSNHLRLAKRASKLR